MANFLLIPKQYAQKDKSHLYMFKLMHHVDKIEQLSNKTFIEKYPSLKKSKATLSNFMS